MIEIVENNKQLNEFIYFIRKLYPSKSNYVYPMFKSLKKDLTKYILNEKSYHALLCYKNNKVLGRILYTIIDNPKLKKKVCY